MTVSSKERAKDEISRAVGRGSNSSEKRYIRKVEKMTVTELKAEYARLENSPEKKKWWIDYRRILFVAMELDDRGYTGTKGTVWRKRK